MLSSVLGAGLNWSRQIQTNQLVEAAPLEMSALEDDRGINTDDRATNKDAPLAGERPDHVRALDSVGESTEGTKSMP